jgi:hypothetical protein
MIAALMNVFRCKQRPPFGGSGSKQKLVVEKVAPVARSPKSKSRRRPQSAPPVRRGNVSGGDSKGQSRRRHGQHGQPKLRTSFEPSASTPDLLRTSDPKSIGGREGASFSFGGTGAGAGAAGGAPAASGSWRVDLASRAERLSSFSFGSGSVETSLVVVQSSMGGAGKAQAQARQRQRKRVSS